MKIQIVDTGSSMCVFIHKYSIQYMKKFEFVFIISLLSRFHPGY